MDGFLVWPKRLDINIFITILSKLHPNIKFTLDRGKGTMNRQDLNMLDITVIHHNPRTIETDILQNNQYTQLFAL